MWLSVLVLQGMGGWMAFGGTADISVDHSTVREGGHFVLMCNNMLWFI